MRFRGILLAACIVAGNPAHAAVVLYNFSGEVIYEGHPNFASPVGSMFTGSFSYDSAVVPSASSPSHALYPGAITALSMTFSGFSATYNGSVPVSTYVQNASSGDGFDDAIDFYLSSPSAISASSVPGFFNSNLLRLYFAGSQNSLSSNSLPSALSLADFVEARVIVGYDSSQVHGRLSSLNVVASGVPEPAAWATMILGFWMIGSVMRRPKNRHLNRYRSALPS